MRILAVACTLTLVWCTVGSRWEGSVSMYRAEGLQDLAVQNDSSRQHRDYKGIFENIQEGLLHGNIGEFSQYFGTHVQVNLQGGENGYYSASQTYYVLENYLRTRKLVTFSFTTIGESDTNPYATGSGGLNVKGTREFIQVYVSLSWAGDRWVISQINIY